MTPRFELNQIHTIAENYSYTSEEEIINLVPVIKQQRYLTFDQLYTVCRWKSPRSAGRAKHNSATFVIEITKFAFSALDERSRIESLTLLDGVDYPTASCILHWFHSDIYPIVDYRAIWSLKLTQGPPYSFAFWQTYFTGWREVLQQAQQEDVTITPRILDKALWQYSKENQP